MKKIVIGCTGFLITVLSCGTAAAWSHAGSYGSVSHVQGEGTTATNRYGATATHATGSGQTSFSNSYGGSATHTYGQGTTATGAYGGTATRIPRADDDPSTCTPASVNTSAPGTKG